MASFVRTPTRVALPVGAALAIMVFTGGALWAQEQGGITGEVREVGTLRPIAGAQVFIEGTTIGSLTNPQGRYLIPTAPAGEVSLRVQLIGYAAQEQTVTVRPGETVTVNFELRQTALQLDEVVVTGAGAAMERRRLGNTIATIDARSIAAAPVQSLSEILTGREAGVVGLPSGGMAGEGARIRIRGSASLSQSNEPVIYVDGVRVDRAGGFGPGIGAGGGGTPSRLDDINPDDIERIEILKGAAAATLYGTQASNGVIQIFTRRGQSGAPRYNLTIEQGFSNYPMNRWQRHAGYVIDEEPAARPHGTDIGARGVREYWGLNVQPYEVFEVDMFSPLFSTGHNQTYALSVSGGTPTITYFASGRFFRENGPYDGSAFEAPGFRVADDKNERRQFRANLEIFPMEDLRFRISSSYVEAYQEAPDNNNNIFGVVSSVINSRPELAHEGNMLGSPTFATTRENFHRRTLQEVQRYGTAFTAMYQATPDISVDATIGIDFVNQHAVRMIPFGWNMDGLASADALGWRRVADRNHREVTLDVKGTWDAAFGSDFTSQLVVGAQGFINRTKSQWGTGAEFAGPGLEVASAGRLQTVFENFHEEAQAGVMVQQQTGFRDFLFATVGARYDEHSAFGETAGGAIYPKASLSVIPSQLPGWGLDAISTLRLRAALGTSGLQPGAFDKFTTFSPIAAETGAGVRPANLGNEDLKPETALEWELGAEVGVLEDRLSLDFTYWNRTVNDVLVERQFAPSGGFLSPQLDNIGQMKANGLEIGANFLAVTRPNFAANFFVNASYLSEEITDMGGAPPLKVGGAYPRYRQFTMEGYAPGSFFGPILDTSAEFPIHRGDCVAMSRAELLDFLSEPRNPTAIHPLVQDCGTGNMLLHFLGKPVPDWQGAIGTDLTFFGNVRLSTLFEYRFGNYVIHDLDFAFRRSHFLIGRNIREAAELEAILLNPASTAEQRLEAADTWVREMEALSPYDGLNEIHDADWLRLREVSLSYQAPAQWAQRVGANSLSFTVGARNVGLWTKFPGRDPELNFNSRGVVSGGVDENFGDGTASWGVPLQRRFTFAINAGF